MRFRFRSLLRAASPGLATGAVCAMCAIGAIGATGWLVGCSGGSPAGLAAPDVAPDAGGASLPEPAADTASPLDLAVFDATPDAAEPDVPMGFVFGWEPVVEGEGEGRLRVAVAPGEAHDLLVIELVAESFDDVLGWAFDLKYHPGVVALEEVALEDVLTGLTWEGRCVAKERGSGVLNVGCARFLVAADLFEMAQYGAPLPGPAVFARLRFRILETGSFELGFDPARRLARGGALSSIPIVWQGATVTVRRGPLGGRR